MKAGVGGGREGGETTFIVAAFQNVGSRRFCGENKLAESVETVIQRFKANRLHPAAVQALSASTDADHVYKIQQAYERENDLLTKILLLETLGKIGTTKAVFLLDGIARKGGEQLLAATAVRALGDSRNEEARQCLQVLKRNRSAKVSSVAGEALAELEKSLAPPKPKPLLPAHLLRRPGEAPAGEKTAPPVAEQKPAAPEPATSPRPLPSPRSAPKARAAAPKPPAAAEFDVKKMIADGRLGEIPLGAVFGRGRLLD